MYTLVALDAAASCVESRAFLYKVRDVRYMHPNLISIWWKSNDCDLSASITMLLTQSY